MAIWLLTLLLAVASLAWTTLCAALLGKTNRGWLYWLFFTVWLFSVVGSCIALTVGWYSISRMITPSYTPHAVTLVVLLAAGSLAVVIAGSRRRDGRLAAGSWPALRIFLAWVILSVLQIALVLYLDAGVRREMQQSREQINLQYAALLQPAPSPESNAADLYTLAFAEINRVLTDADAAEEQRFYDELSERNEDSAIAEDTDAEIPEDPEPTTKPSDLLSFGNVDDPRTASIVRSLEPAVHQLRQASMRPVCRFDDNQEPPDIDRALPSLGNFRTAAHLLRCHAALEARSQRFSAAMEDIDALHRMARHAQQTTVGLVPFLVATGIDALAVQALADVLPYATAPVSVPGAIQSSDRMLDTELRACLVGEYAFEVRTALDFCEGRPMSGLGAPIPQRVAMAYRIVFLHSDLSAFRQMHDAVMARVDGKPMPEEAEWAARGGRPPGGLLSQILTPSLWRVLNKTCPNRQAEARAAAIAVALTNHRLETGHYPESLEELVPKYLPAVPADPFDGHPMRYLLKDNQATMYSVGEDRVDDNGQMERTEDDPRPKTLDVGVVLKMPIASTNKQ